MGNQTAVPCEPSDEQQQSDAATALFERFAGPEPLGFSDPYWSELLSSNFELAEFSAAEFDSVAGHFCHDLASHNLQTGNFVVLTQHLVSLLNGLPDEPSVLHDMVLNACFLTRMYAKYFIETMGKAALMAQLSAGGADDDVAEVLVRSLVGALARMQITVATYVVSIEIIKTLLILFSTQLNESPQCSGSHVFMDIAMSCTECSTQLLQQLLSNTLAAPEIVVRCSEPAPEHHGPPRSILASLTTVATTVPTALFQIPYRIYKYIFSGTIEDGSEQGEFSPVQTHSNLKRLAALLLLTLLVYRPRTPETTNPYCEALSKVRDCDDPTARAPGELCRGASIGFQALYDSLCEQLHSDDAQLLVLYQLLWHSRSFRDLAIHVRTDIDTLLLPLTRCVYDSSDSDTTVEPLQPARLSVALSCVMMLSESPAFSVNAQSAVVEAVPWCTERVLTDIPLSSVLLIVLLRSVYASLHSHTGHAGGTLCTCLAAIANMAPHIKDMHPHAAQRLVQLLEILGKKVGRLFDLKEKGCAPTEEQAVDEEIFFFQDLTQMLLDVFSVVLVQGEPALNSHLTYSLLHRQEEALRRLRAVPFSSMPNISEYTNSLAVLVSKLQDLIPEGPTDVDAVHEVITTHANKLARELRASGPTAQEPRDNYLYDEQRGTDEFFAPYLWQVVVQSSGVKWSESRIMLYPVPSLP